MQAADILNEPNPFRRLTERKSRPHDETILAAVTAFASLNRPTQRERVQIDLICRPVLPLLEQETLRRMSALLSCNGFVPEGLLRALTNMAPAIAAPLVLRSPLLNDEMLAAIAAIGNEHRTIVASRTDRRSDAGNPRPSAKENRPLLAMIERQTCTGPDVAQDSNTLPIAAQRRYELLLDKAMSDSPALLATTVAETLGLPFGTVCEILSDPSGGEATCLWLALGLTAGEAISLAHLLGRRQPLDRERTRMFHKRLVSTRRESALETLSSWRESSQDLPAPAPANANPVSRMRKSVA
jgi:uncharacterized protein (DUF2336 family)